MAGVIGAQEKLNLTFVDGQGKMLPTVDILESLKGKFGDLNAVDLAEIKKGFGSAEASSFIAALIGKTEQLKGSINDVSTADFSLVEKMAGDIADPFDRASAASEALKIKLGNLVLPAVNSFMIGLATAATSLMGVVDSLVVDWGLFVEKLKTGDGIYKVVREAVDAIGVGFAAIGAAIAPVIPFFSEFAGTAAAVVAAMTGGSLLFSGVAAAIGLIGSAVSAVGAILLANPITALVAAIAISAKLIYDNWDAIVPYFTQMIDDIKALLGSSEVGQAILGAFSVISDTLTPIISGIYNAVSDAWLNIKTVISEQGLVNGSIALFDQLKNSIMSDTRELTGGVSQQWGIMGATIEDGSAASRAAEIWKELKPSVLSAVTDLKIGLGLLWSDISSGLGSAFADMKAIWEEIKLTYKSLMSALGLDTESSMGEIKGAFDTGWGYIKDIVSGSWEVIKGVINLGWEAITGIFSIALSILRGDWDGAWNGLIDVVKGFWTNIKGIFSGMAEDFGQFGVDIANGLSNGIKNAASGAADAAVDMASGVASSFKSFLGIESPSKLMMGYGENIAQGAAIGIANGSAGAVKSTASLAEQISGTFADMGNEIESSVVSGLQSMVDTGNDLLDSFIDKLIEAALSADSFSGVFSSLTGGGSSSGGIGDLISSGISSLFGYSAGGYTGNIDPKDVAGVVHGQEFVINAAATAKNRPALEAINSGKALPAITQTATNNTESRTEAQQINVKPEISIQLVEDASKAGQVSSSQIGEKEVVQIVVSNIYGRTEITNAMNSRLGTSVVGTV